MSECILCELIEEEIHAELWRAFYDEGIEAALAVSDGAELDLTPKQLRGHFDGHRPPQATAKRRQKIRERVERYGERRRLLLETAFRVRGMGAELAAAALYWTGEPGEGAQTAASKNAMLALRDFYVQDLLYRVYLEHLPGPRMRKLPPPAYFLGLNGLPYIAESFGRKPAPGEYLTRLSQAPDREHLRRWQLEQQLPTALFAQLPERLTTGRRAQTRDGWRVELDVRDLYDRRLAEIAFTDPVKEYRRIRAGGIGALRIANTEGGSLIPFFHYYDRGATHIDKLVGELRSHLGLVRSPELMQTLPQLGGGAMPLILVLVSDPERLRQLESATRAAGSAGAQLPALATEASSLSGRSPWDASWLPLFSSHGQRVSLVDALQRMAPQFSDAGRLRVGGAFAAPLAVPEEAPLAAADGAAAAGPDLSLGETPAKWQMRP